MASHFRSPGFKKPFRGEWMKCTKCGKWRKSYVNFESQWTMMVIDDSEVVYVCPSCWGIPDPAPDECKRVGHDFEQARCCRCGVKQEV